MTFLTIRECPANDAVMQEFLYELETRADGAAQRFYERHGWVVMVARDDYYNHAAWVLMTKTP